LWLCNVASCNVKGELQTMVAGPFSPAGTAKFFLVCGAYNATNSTTEPVVGGYSEFNLRNNSAGDTTLGNGVQLLGSGLTLLDPLGSAPQGSKVILGNLTMGGGQELGLYLSAQPSHVVVFQSVTLTGGNAMFSPKTPLFGATTSAGSDLSLGAISETSTSGIIMAGVSNLFLTGVNTYSGNTVISNGTLALTGSASIANSPNIRINGGAAFDVSGLSSTFALGSSQTLTGNNPTGTINGSMDLSSGALAVSYTSGTPTLTEINGTLTMNDNAVTVTVQGGTPLASGNFKLISAGVGGSVAGSVSSSLLTVNGAGAAASTRLKIISGELYLVVNSPPVANPGSYTRAAGLPLKTAIAGDLATNWSDVDGDPISMTGAISSTNGAAVTYDASYVYYSNSNNVADEIDYTVSDGQGGTASGVINLTVISGASQSFQSSTTDVNSHPVLTGNGIPGYTYGVEKSDNVSGPWTNAAPVTVDNKGGWNFTDTNATVPPDAVFYRLYWPYDVGNPPQ
jgi:autotransporter-associated beta strand protein